MRRGFAVNQQHLRSFADDLNVGGEASSVMVRTEGRTGLLRASEVNTEEQFRVLSRVFVGVDAGLKLNDHFT